MQTTHQPPQTQTHGTGTNLHPRALNARYSERREAEGRECAEKGESQGKLERRKGRENGAHPGMQKAEYSEIRVNVSPYFLPPFLPVLHPYCLALSFFLPQSLPPSLPPPLPPASVSVSALFALSFVKVQTDQREKKKKLI